MITTIIPLPIDRDYYTITVNLSGTDYELDLSWNARADLWFLSLWLPGADSREAVVLSSPCVLRMPLTAGVDFPGELVVVGQRDPQRNDWGSVAKLAYVTAE